MGSVRREPFPLLGMGEIAPHPSDGTKLLSVLSGEGLEVGGVGVDALVVGHAVDGVEDGRVEGGALGEGEEDGFDCRKRRVGRGGSGWVRKEAKAGTK